MLVHYPLWLGWILPAYPYYLITLTMIFFIGVVRLQGQEDARLRKHRFRSKEDHQKTTLAYIVTLMKMDCQTEAAKFLWEAIKEFANPTHMQMYLFDKKQDGYVTRNFDDSKPESHFFEPFDSQIPIILGSLSEPYLYLSLSEDHGLIDLFSTEELEKPDVVIPIPDRRGLLGWIALGPRKDGIAYQLEVLDQLSILSHQFSVVYDRCVTKNISLNRMQAFEDLYQLKQIDREITVNYEVDRIIKAALTAACNHTHASAGSIGLINTDQDQFYEIWQILPQENTPNQRDPVEINDLTIMSEQGLEPQVIHNLDLQSVFNLSDTYQWHYLSRNKLDEQHASFMVLHLDSPDILDQSDKSFLKQLQDHTSNALKNALLYEELHGVIQSKNEFISYISHELKNPLTVIKGYADILSKGMAGDINDEQKDYLATIAHNVRQMNKFINDLSDQSYIDTKSLRLIFESANVNEVVDEVLQSYEGQIKKKSIQIRKDMPGSIENVWCDRLRLIQILSNLVSNAVKYTPDGGEVEIGAEQTPNEWDQEGAAEVIHFWVKDTGYGIPLEDQAHLFEKFYRGTGAHLQNIAGTGLGLRISRSLTEMMGGKIWFSSKPGSGSIFHFTIPI